MARRKPAGTGRKTKSRARHGAGTNQGSTFADVSTEKSRSDAPKTIEPEALVVSHWFDPGSEGDAYSATVRLTGRRLGIRGQVKPSDTFVQEDKVEGIVPGSGRMSITSWVYGLQPGEWTVSADLIRPDGYDAVSRPTDRWRRSRTEHLPRARWSWRRWSVEDGEETPLKTRWSMLAPLARTPAVLPGSFTLMGVLGIVAALFLQSALLGREEVPVAPALAVSVLALVGGLIGAKLWYAYLHPGPWRHSLGGWSVDGFLVVAPVVALVALLTFNLPIGLFLDASAPAIFFAVAIGRFGCFFTGCCAGRSTASRWGVRSSDRRVVARRVPAQLIESAAGMAIGLSAFLLVLAGVPPVRGLVFIAAIAAYIVVRQFLLRVRAERREFSWRRSSLVSSQPLRMIDGDENSSS